MSQVIQLAGVLDDGTALYAGTPRNTATTILFPQFTDVTVDVLVVNNAGTIVDLTTLPNGWSALLTFQRVLDPCQCIPELQVVGAWALAPNELNRLRFSFTAKQTRNLNLGRYFFDVALVVPSGLWAGRHQIVRVSQAVLQASMARA